MFHQAKGREREREEKEVEGGTARKRDQKTKTVGSYWFARNQLEVNLFEVVRSVRPKKLAGNCVLPRNELREIHTNGETSFGLSWKMETNFWLDQLEKGSRLNWKKTSFRVDHQMRKFLNRCVGRGKRKVRLDRDENFVGVGIQLSRWG